MQANLKRHKLRKLHQSVEANLLNVTILGQLLTSRSLANTLQDGLQFHQATHGKLSPRSYEAYGRSVGNHILACKRMPAD